MELAEHLHQLETSLLTQSTRKDETRVRALLADQFQEFGSSGRVYSKADIVAALQDETPVRLSMTDFAMKPLAPGVAVLTYRSTTEADGLPARTALRSSIWILEGEQWRMIFHQGTSLPGVPKV